MCNLSIASWNIDGIFHRLDNERCCKLDEKTVIEKISKFDIIGLIETHCGPQDHLFLEDYYTFQINRKKNHQGLVNLVVGLPFSSSNLSGKASKYYQ